MKKIALSIIITFGLIGCFEDVNNSLGRDQFIGNYDFVLTCTGSFASSSHIIFIEKPIGNADSLSSMVIIRNLLNQNKTIQAVISQNDVIFNDDYITGTGSLNNENNQLTLILSFGDSDCKGMGTRRL